MSALLRTLASPFLCAGAAAFTGGALLWEMTGLFTLKTQSVRQAFYGDSVLWGGVVLAVCLGARIVRAPEAPDGTGKRNTVFDRLFRAAIIVGVAGLWAGKLFSFSGDIVLTEGQEFSGSGTEYVPGSLKQGRFATIPELHLMMGEVTPELSKAGTRLDGLTASVSFLDRPTARVERRTLSSRWPILYRGTWLFLDGFGYSPLYHLLDQGGRVLDESFVALKLFPPGEEDYFRLLLPHTFYLRYVLLAPDMEGAAGRSGMAYRVRVARNKDLVAETTVFPGEPVAFDSASIVFDPPRRWTGVTVIRDPGIPFSIGAFAVALLCLAASRLRSPGPREPR